MAEKIKGQLEDDFWPELSQSSNISDIEMNHLVITDFPTSPPVVMPSVVQDVDLLTPLPPPLLIDIPTPICLDAFQPNDTTDCGTSQDIPVYSQPTTSMLNQDIPVYSQPTTSMLSQDIPVYSQPTSILSQNNPVYSQDIPVYSQDIPVYSQPTTSILSQDIPVYSKDNPVYSQPTTSILSQDIPVYSQDNPVYSPIYLQNATSCHSSQNTSGGASISISNIHHEVTNDELRQLIQRTVTFSSTMEAFSCVSLNGSELRGQPIQIKFKDSSDTVQDVPAAYPQPQKITMSRHLHKCFLNSAAQDIHLFEREEGGVLTYFDDCLYIEGPTVGQIETFINKIVMKYCEKPLLITEEHWDDLMRNNSTKYNSLVLPFQTNTSISILPIKEGTTSQLLLVGLSEAVNSAFKYFSDILFKDLRVNRLKLQALQLVYPDLSNSIFVKYQVTITYSEQSIIIDGLIPQNIAQARRELENKISEIFIEKLPPCKPILLLSFKRFLASTSPGVIIINNGDTNHICCLNNQVLKETLKFYNRPFHREVVTVNEGSRIIMESLRNKHSQKLCDIEQEFLVDISVNDTKVVLCGYVESSLKSAKDKVKVMTKNLIVEKRAIKCSPGLEPYLHHILFSQPNEEIKKFLSNLRTKVTTERSVVYLEGPFNLVNEDEKSILSFVIPPGLEFKEFSFDTCDCRFISHIESEVLRSLHQRISYTHVVRRHGDQEKGHTHSSGRHSRNQRRSSEVKKIGFTITVFSAKKDDFEVVCTEIKKLNPHTETVSVSLAALEHITEMKNLLEKTHSVRIFIVNSPPKVIIHGLRDDDIGACRIGLEGSFVSTKKIDLSGHEILYLKIKCSTKLDEWKEKCQLLSLPPMKIPTEELSKKFFIQITGKTSLIDTIVQEIKEFLSNFYVKQFNLSCSQMMILAWKKRWNEIKKEMENKHNVLIEFSESKINSEAKKSSAPGKPTSIRTPHNTKSNVSFIVSGLTLESVEEVCEIIKNKEDGSIITKQIPIKSEYPSINHPGELAKMLGLTGSIWLHLDGANLIISAPSSMISNIDEIVDKITTHLESQSIKTITFEYNDKFLCLFVKMKCKEILGKATEVAKREKVRISLNFSKSPFIHFSLKGSEDSIQVVKGLIEEAIEAIKRKKHTKALEIDYLKCPYFDTEEFKTFSQQVQKQYYVLVSTPNEKSITSSGSVAGVLNVVIQSKMIQSSIKVSLIKGDILKESVECIVNAANGRLQHVGGLAAAVSNAGGPSIQIESNRYVERNGQLNSGDAVCLGAGLLPYKHIIHAVAPIWSTPGIEETGPVLLQRAVLNVCNLAHEHKISTIALPALGTGIYNIPADVCAMASLQAINMFCKKHSSASTLLEVRFVLQQPLIIKAFTKVFDSPNAEQLPFQVPPQLPTTIPSPQAPISPLKWYWLDDKPHKYTPYDEHTNGILTEAYRSTSTVPCPVTINGTSYTIDFQSMCQINTKTQYSRKIRLSKEEEKEEEEESNGVEWYYKNDEQGWSLYDIDSSSQLEKWYQGDLPTGQLNIGKHYYTFDFTSMKQMNVSTRHQRDIKRVGITEEEEEIQDTKIKWLFQNDKEQYQEYTQEQSEQLEDWYQNNEPTTNCQMIIGKFKYSFDLSNMTQCNLRTNTTRNMKREIPKELIPQSFDKKVTITLCGPREGIDRVVIQLQGKLNNCLSTERLSISSSSTKLEASLHRIARQHHISFKILPSKKDSKEAHLTGLNTLVKEALTDMQKCLINHIETVAASAVGGVISVKPPKEWQAQQKTVELFEVEGSLEYSDVERKFKATLHNARIHSIKRIQNRYLWDKYSNHKNSLHQKNGGQVNELELFHGTRGNDPKNIYDSEEGFDMRFSAQGMWGQANYFAVNASYSNGYAHPTNISSITHGQVQVKQMFLAKVLTGVTYQCQPDRSLRMPPERPSYASPTGVQLSQVRYDTVKGNTNGSDVYMTYDNLKAYPAYLISYDDGASRFRFF